MERRRVGPILEMQVALRTRLRVGVKSAALILSLIVSAYVTAGGLGSASHSWLAWVALLPLFAAIRLLDPVRAMLCGALWGFCLHVFAAAPVGTGLDEGMLSLALLTAIPAIYAYLCARLTRWIGFNPLVLGVGWMGVALTFELLGQDNGLLAGIQGDGALMHWIGGALGYVLVAFVVAFASSVLLVMLSRARVALASPRYLPAPGPRDTHLIPQTFCCFPLFLIHSSHPRAPPGA